MGTSQKCPKCNQEHDLSLAKCPEVASAATRVLPPTPPKSSPSARMEPKREVPKATVKMDAESLKAPERAQPEATIIETTKPPMIPGPEALASPVLSSLEALASSAPPLPEVVAVAPEVPEPPREVIPPNTKSSSPSLAALAASFEAPPKAEVRAEPRNETKLSGDALVLPPPQNAKEKVAGLYQQKIAPSIKGREKVVGGVALALVLLLGWALWPNGKATTTTNSPKESPLFSANPPVSPSTQEAGTETPEPNAPDANSVPLHVEASPASTVIIVWVDGAVFHSGAAPLDIAVPRDSVIEVTLAAAGYAPEQKTFTAKEERSINESLSKLSGKSGGSSGGSAKSGGNSAKSGGNSGGWGGWGGK